MPYKKRQNATLEQKMHVVNTLKDTLLFEDDVAVGYKDGWSDDRIAGLLSVSSSTVRFVRKDIFDLRRLRVRGSQSERFASLERRVGQLEARQGMVGA